MSDEKPIMAAEAPTLVDVAVDYVEENDPALTVTMRVNGVAVQLTPYEAVLLKRTLAGLLLRQGVTEL